MTIKLIKDLETLSHNSKRSLHKKCKQMAGTKILSLKRFMRRQEVLKLYRTFFRTIQKLPDKGQQAEIALWVRSDFKANANIDPANEEQIKALIFQGQKMLNELKNNVDFSQA